MTITIDCRQIDSSGVGVYIRECLPLFLESPHVFQLLGNPAKLEYLGPKDKKNVRIYACHIKPFSLKELFFFPRKLLKLINSAHLYYSPFFNVPGGIKVPVFTTIHDIIFPDMPELSSKIGLFIRMWFYKRAGKKSKTIFTVSEFSKSRIQHYLGRDKRVIVSYSAIQSYIAKSAVLNGDTAAKKNKSIIFIGNIKKHKGLSTLLEAFYQARKEGLDYVLIIVGSKDDFRSSDRESLSRIEDAEKGSVRFTGYISNEALLDFIVSAALLVQASLYEGFCLPPLEAMMLGTAALISDIPVLKEIYADCPAGGVLPGKPYPVTFFKAGSAADLKNKLMELLYDKPFITIRLDEELRGRYTFKKTAAIIVQEWNTVQEGKNA